MAVFYDPDAFGRNLYIDNVVQLVTQQAWPELLKRARFTGKTIEDKGDADVTDLAMVDKDPCFLRFHDEPGMGVPKGSCGKLRRDYTIVVETDPTRDCDEGYMELAYALTGEICVALDGTIKVVSQPNLHVGERSGTRGGSKPPP